MTESSDNTPLVVDLDGTLAPVDTLHESILSLISSNPPALLRLAGWVTQGRDAVANNVAQEVVLRPSDLPLNEEVLEHVRAARSNGRPTALVSSADQRQLEAIDTELDLFDEVKGSVDGAGFDGDAKAAWLVERFGDKGYDFIGNSATDLPVWNHARNALSAHADEALRKQLDRLEGESEHLAPQPNGLARLKPYIKAMRPHQWLKNMLVFVPALAAHDPGAFGPALIAFILFSLVASSAYLLNDMLDLQADRAHPRKRKRPFAAGDIPVAHGMVQVVGLLLVSGVVALWTQPLFFAVLATYLVLTLLYSFVLKRKLIVDICTLGGLYTIRIVGGGAAAGLAISPWLLGFSMFIFLALAAVKRLAEILDIIKRGETSAAGRAYEARDLPVVLGIALASGYSAVLIFALYISSDAVVSLYSTPDLLWLFCPILLYWISRMTIIAHRGEMHDDPIVFALRDKVSLVVLSMMGALFVVSSYI
ncbi:UbiA family prenyltransferase [Rhodobacteraceae bacterium NNCM2]|nr:UbiA family prenyltransferase [Coraliihabitans acroporae]